MALKGKAFMIMWHDIAPEAETEYHLWHTREHMPERLGHRGFLRSRRGVNWGSEHQRYFTLYEGEELQTLLSEDYTTSLNNPTAWTTRMAPHFRNFRRMACQVRSTAGIGVGGALATFRVTLSEGKEREQAVEALKRLVEALLRRAPVTGVHVATAEPEYSEQRTREVELRPAMAEPSFDIVMVVEGIGLQELERDAAEMKAGIEALELGEVVAQCYDMAYLLERETA